MTELKKFYTQREDLPAPLLKLYNGVKSARNNLGALEEDYLNSERVLSVEKWNFVERENDFYQLEIIELLRTLRTEAHWRNMQPEQPQMLLPPPPPPPHLPPSRPQSHPSLVFYEEGGQCRTPPLRPPFPPPPPSLEQSTQRSSRFKLAAASPIPLVLNSRLPPSTIRGVLDAHAHESAILS